MSFRMFGCSERNRPLSDLGDTPELDALSSHLIFSPSHPRDGTKMCSWQTAQLLGALVGVAAPVPAL